VAEGLGADIRVLPRDVECSECKDRTSPSDAAFGVVQAAHEVGFGAEVVWAEWDETDDEAARQGELVRVFVPCPWDEADDKYLILEIVGEGFAD
jgi:hypothetical protein